MSTTVYTYSFPGADTYLGAVTNAGSDLFPSNTLDPGNNLDIGTPPTFGAALYPGLSVVYAVVPDPVERNRVPAPIFEVLVADTRTGRIEFQVPHTKFSWDSSLNTAGSMTVTVPIERSSKRRSRRDEYVSANMLAEIASGPWRFTFALVFGGRVVWAGPMVAVKLTASSSTVDFGCVEVDGILARRLLLAAGNAGVTTPSADVTYQGTSLENIMRSLFALSMTPTGAELPIDLPTVNTTGGHQRFYYGYDVGTIGERVTALTKVINGPDYRLDPYLVTAPDGNYLRYSLAIGDPYLNVIEPWHFVHGGNASLDYDLDAKDMAFDWYTPGSGQDRDKKMGYATDRALLDAGFPMLQAVDSSHASASEQVTLDAWAKGSAAQNSKPIESWSLVTRAFSDPRLGEYRVGDEMAVDVVDHLLIEDGLFSRRITKLSGDDSGAVTMSGDSKPEEYTMEGDVSLLGATESTEETTTITQASVPPGVWTVLLAWGYVPVNGSLAVPRSTIAAGYAYQDTAGLVA